MFSNLEKKYVLFHFFHKLYAGRKDYRELVLSRGDLKELFIDVTYFAVSDDEFDDLFTVEPSMHTNSYRSVSTDFAERRYIISSADALSIALQVFDCEEVRARKQELGQDWFDESIDNLRRAWEIRSGHLDEQGIVPASDRYVSREDNRKEFEDTQMALEQVREAVRGNNEGSEEEKIIVLSEIAMFEAGLVQPRLAHDLIVRFLEFCKRRLAKLIGDTLTTLVTEKLAALVAIFLALS